MTEAPAAPLVLAPVPAAPRRLCTVPGCGKTHHAQALCPMHYRRKRRAAGRDRKNANAARNREREADAWAERLEEDPALYAATIAAVRATSKPVPEPVATRRRYRVAGADSAVLAAVLRNLARGSAA